MSRLSNINLGQVTNTALPVPTAMPPTPLPIHSAEEPEPLPHSKLPLLICIWGALGLFVTLVLSSGSTDVV